MSDEVRDALDLDDVPMAVAAKLARRCWSVAREDLEQEAKAAALHAVKNFDPAKGELRGYLWRSIARHLTNYMWEAGSPVTYKHRRNELRNARGVGVESPSSGVINMPNDVDVRGDVSTASWRARVTSRLQTLAEIEDEVTGCVCTEYAIPCLLGEATPLAVARERGVPLNEMLQAADRLRSAVTGDPVMAQLWRELGCGRRTVRPARVDDYDGGEP